jgi:hypothetical protein
MAVRENIFVSDQRRVWMRLRDHTVVFERDPDFPRFVADPSGSVLRIARVWVAGAESGSPLRYYVGSVRRCECGGWTSRRELIRLFRRATATAGHLGESAHSFRARLSGYLRETFDV